MKTAKLGIAWMALIIAVSQLGNLVSSQAPSVDTGPALFSGQLAFDRVGEQVAFGPRPTGSAEIIRAGNAALSYLEGLGWQTSEDWHTLDFGGPLLVPARNLIASYGRGPTVILGGHYDTRVFTDNDPNPNLRSERATGANDNGSGVGILLELARVISQHYTPNNQIRLVFFDAEDNPHIPPWQPIMGSTLYVDGLDLEKENIRYVIVLDMLGDDNQLIPIEQNSKIAAPEVTQGIWEVARELGYDQQFVSDAGRGYSLQDDHIAFIRRGIPAVLLIDFDYPYWHTTQDTLDKIRPDSLERVGRVLQVFLERDGVISPK